MKAARLFLAMSAALFVTACDNDDDDPVVTTPPEPPVVATSTVQVLHASPDAPAVNVLVDGDEVLAGVDYKQASEALTLDEGTYTFQVDGLLPGGAATVIGPVDLDLAGDTAYTIAAVNSVADIDALVVEQPLTEVTAESARLFVIHAAAEAPAVDVFVTTPGADLAATAATGSFEFGETIGPAEVAAGDYQVRVTPAGDPTTVVFDSGTVALPDGADLTIAAVPNTSGGAAPVSLVVLDGSGASEILDLETPTSLQVVHASPDAPAVDVLVDGTALVEDLEYPQATGFVEVPAASYEVAVTVADNPGMIAIGPVTLDLLAGVRYSVLAVGELATIDALILDDDARRVATNAKVRLVHASPSAGDVDVYVTAPGADLVSETPAIEAFAFRDNSGYLALPAGTYEVTVTAAGTTTAAIGPLEITVEDGGIYTAIARDPLPGESDFGVIVSDDFVL